MSPEEFDTSLSDLETRVDRLRALYENWFRGYEKAEPAVARKEVERKVYALRKELPRNTALRFRYHQLYQRYTTLASYWQRTARQIEEGTYRLQIKRMRRRNDQSASDDNARTIAPRPSLEDRDSSEPAAYELRLDESLDINQLLDEASLSSLGDALARPAPSGEGGAASAPKSPARRFARPSSTFTEPPPGRSFTLEERDHEGLPAELTGGRASMPTAASGATRESTPRGSMPSLEPGPARMQSGYPTLPPSARIPAANTGAVPGMPPPPRVPLVPPASGARAGVKLPPAAKAGVQRPAIASLPPPSPKLPAAPNTGTLAAPRPPPPPPPSQQKPGVAPPRAAVPAAPKPGAFSSPPPTGGLPKPSPRASVPPARPSAGPSLAPRPAPARVAPPPPPARPTAPPVPRPPMPSQAQPSTARPTPEALGEQRMRRLYDEYAAARRKNNEGDVRYESLQSSIQKMLPDLRKKHQGKNIDFEVVIKDGRVGLKPKPT